MRKDFLLSEEEKQRRRRRERLEENVATKNTIKTSESPRRSATVASDKETLDDVDQVSGTRLEERE